MNHNFLCTGLKGIGAYNKIGQYMLYDSNFIAAITVNQFLNPLPYYIFRRVPTIAKDIGVANNPEGVLLYLKL